MLPLAAAVVTAAPAPVVVPAADEDEAAVAVEVVDPEDAAPLVVPAALELTSDVVVDDVEVAVEVVVPLLADVGVPPVVDADELEQAASPQTATATRHRCRVILGPLLQRRPASMRSRTHRAPPDNRRGDTVK